MKFFSILILLTTINLTTINLEAKDIYSYKEYDLNGNETLKGKIIFDKNNENIHTKISVDIIGEKYSLKYEIYKKLPQGFLLWDIKDIRDATGISIYAYLLDMSIIKDGYKTNKIELTDLNHPYFKDKTWVYKSEFRLEDEIKINGKLYKGYVAKTFGSRNSGYSACLFGQVGVIKIYGYYSLEGKLLKQVFEKRHCIPDSNRILTREVIEII